MLDICFSFNASDLSTLRTQKHSHTQVIALRKELRQLQVELAHARFAGLATLGCGGDGEKVAHAAALEEAAVLRRYW